LLRHGDDALWRSEIAGNLLWARLGDLPVLAELAVDVASGGGDGEGYGSRQIVEERLLLNGINMSGAETRVDKRIESAAAILAYAARASFSVVHDACTGTEPAPDFAIRELFVERGFYREAGGGARDAGGLHMVSIGGDF
jgi:hypothetical protein